MIKSFLALLLLVSIAWLISNQLRIDVPHETSPFLTCQPLIPVPLRLPPILSEQTIGDERSTLESTDIFDLPEARRMLRLERSLERFARRSLVHATRRFWDISCLLSSTAHILRQDSCEDVTRFMERGGDLLRLEESRIRDSLAELESHKSLVEAISTAAVRDAELAREVEFSGEDSPILIQQSVLVPDSLLQWTHLPDRLAPHVDRVTAICEEASWSTTVLAATIRGLREHYDKMAKTFSNTNLSPGQCQGARTRGMKEMSITIPQLFDLRSEAERHAEYYADLFRREPRPTRLARFACLGFNSTWL